LFLFSIGPRHCLGKDFAIIEISYTIIQILQAIPYINLLNREHIDPIRKERQKLEVVLTPTNKCRVIIS
jgi:cytochrome P450